MPNLIPPNQDLSVVYLGGLPHVLCQRTRSVQTGRPRGLPIRLKRRKAGAKRRAKVKQ